MAALALSSGRGDWYLAEVRDPALLAEIEPDRPTTK
jgi:hypothetical protein